MGLEMYSDAEWYDRSIDWSARIGREIPVLMDLFGPPGDGGILDVGCGTGRQACALAQQGYRVVGADASEPMLELARIHAAEVRGDVRFVLSTYEKLPEVAGQGFDGMYCIGNSLAAAGTRDVAQVAVRQFARCLRPGGVLFVQTLNYPLLAEDHPYVMGPRRVVVDGVEYVSVRLFHFVDPQVEVTNLTLWQADGWQCRSHSGTLHPVSLDELQEWQGDAGLQIESVWGNYSREHFNPARHTDLIIVSRRC